MPPNGLPPDSPSTRLVTRLDGTYTESLEAFEIPWVFFQGKDVTHKDVRFLPRGQAHSVEVVDGSPRVMLYELE